MIILYKLLFDFALYYVISGQYLQLITGDLPSVPGFLLLILAEAAAGLARKYAPDKKWVLSLSFPIPFAVLLTGPGLGQLLQLVPAWLYLIWTEWTGRLYTDETAFSYHFGHSLWTLLLIVPTMLVAPKKWLDCLTNDLPYLILLLLVGVCLLRILRAKKPDTLRQSLILLGFLAACLVFSLLGLPAILAKGLEYSWTYFFKIILEILATLAGIIAMGFAAALSWILKHLNFPGTSEQLKQNVENALNDNTLEQLQQKTDGSMEAFKIFLIIIGSLLAVFILYLLFKGLAGSKEEPKKPGQGLQRTPEYVPSVKRFRAGLLRPSDPRMAVRYYLQKTLREGRRRGAVLSPAMTAEELSEALRGYLPSECVQELVSLYRPARYSLQLPVSKKDADRAEALWKKLKK